MIFDLRRCIVLKKIKIDFVDFWQGFDKTNNDFYKILNEKYIVEISDNPEYIFYSCFGFEHVKYDCVRIFYTGECVTPDFNICDYAIGFDYMSFGDRYVRIPLYMLFQYKEDYERALKKHLYCDENNSGKSFCNFIYSNCSAQKSREDFFYLLSEYKKVDSGGRYLNNIGCTVKNKYDFQKNYKFSIAFENTCYKGYTTEKIIQAFSAGTVPIYYGNPDIEKEFNSEAFINVHNFNTMEDVIKRIIEIDMNDELFQNMIKAPICSKKNDNELKSFLYSIMSQPYASARRRPLNITVKEKERQENYIRYINIVRTPIVRLFNLLKKIKSKCLIK